MFFDALFQAAGGFLDVLGLAFSKSCRKSFVQRWRTGLTLDRSVLVGEVLLSFSLAVFLVMVGVAWIGSL